jgi:hypothetical protein
MSYDYRRQATDTVSRKYAASHGRKLVLVKAVGYINTHER